MGGPGGDVGPTLPSVAATTQTPSEVAAAVFEGVADPREFLSSEATQRCPTSLVAVGINGRSGVWLDAVGRSLLAWRWLSLAATLPCLKRRTAVIY
jgi:hypothetical protein